MPQQGRGRPRTRLARVRADKAYDSRRNRSYLRRRDIKATIPVPADRVHNRRKLGSRGGLLDPLVEAVLAPQGEVVEHRRPGPEEAPEAHQAPRTNTGAPRYDVGKTVKRPETLKALGKPRRSW